MTLRDYQIYGYHIICAENIVLVKQEDRLILVSMTFKSPMQKMFEKL
jgi:hypothetical protein